MRHMIFLLFIACGTEPKPPEPNPEPIVWELETERSDKDAVYRLSFQERASQYFQVHAEIPTRNQEQLDLMMATWTPGSYLIREYSRNVEGLQVYNEDGELLAVHKTSKNRWRVTSEGSSKIRLTYKLYAHELNVRGNWVEEDFAIINGAPTYIVDANHLEKSAWLSLELPETWKHAHLSLRQDDGMYFADDFDTLVDTPILLGNTKTYPFVVDGIAHELVNLGESEVWDGSKSAADVETIVRTQVEFWENIPYPQYLFLNALVESRGGLEHKHSTLTMSARFNSHDRESYLDWLGLISHEFFHTWNVKRLRPQSLGPFDYEVENYTRSLWIAEGLTSYYDDLLLLRAGLMTEGEYLSRLSNQISGAQSKEGRKVRSLEQASYDAWIKHYRKDENFNNVAVSYYTKGAVVGWLLDMQIREKTNGAKSLDDVMVLASSRFSGDKGFTPKDFQNVAEEIAGQTLEPFFRDFVRGTKELPLARAAQWVGLLFDDPGPSDPPEQWLGMETMSSRGRTLVEEIRKGTPAFESNLIVGDEIIAINNFRVHNGNLLKRLEQLSKDGPVELLVARREKLFTVSITPAATPLDSYSLSEDPSAEKASRKRRQHWMNGSKP